MKKYLVLLLVIALSSLSFAQMPSAPKKPRPMNMPMRQELMAKLNLTDKQKEDLKNLRYETAKRQIDLRAKLAASRLELAQLLGSDSPNQAAIEKQMKEVANNQVALRTNRLNAWFEANKQLTPEQQKIWRGALRHVVQQRARQVGMMERGGMMQMRGRMNGQGECNCDGMGMNGSMK
jgi:Spy/CpxP family protein refolding chaperone